MWRPALHLGVERGRGTDRRPQGQPEAAGLPPRLRGVKVQLGVDGAQIRPRPGERFKVPKWFRDHEMDVQEGPGMGPDRFHERRAEGDVRHEVPVHHVEVENLGARLLQGSEGSRQRGEVGRKDGGEDARPGPQPRQPALAVGTRPPFCPAARPASGVHPSNLPLRPGALPGATSSST